MDLRGELECIICGSLLCDPRVLNCQHCFCMKCLFNLVGKDEGSNVRVKCPYGCEPTIVGGGDSHQSHETQEDDGGEGGDDGVDIRSLKKNHRIGRMALAYRKADFSKYIMNKHLSPAERKANREKEKQQQKLLGGNNTNSPTRTRNSPMKFPVRSSDGQSLETAQKKEDEEEDEDDTLYCEWCSQGLPQPAEHCCQECGTYMCSSCHDDISCDHVFLCSSGGGDAAAAAHDPKTTNGNSTTLGGISGGGNQQTNQQQAEALHPFFFPEDAEKQVLEDVLKKMPHLEGKISFRETELVYAPFYQCEAKCTANDGNLKQSYPVLAPAEDLDPVLNGKAISESYAVQIPTKSDEMMLLHEVRVCMKLAQETAEKSIKLLQSMLPAIKISVTADEINVVDTLSKSLAMMQRMGTLYLKPMCQRLIIIANVLGYCDLEVLQQPILGEGHPTRRARMQQRVELIQVLSADSAQSVEKATKEATKAETDFDVTYRKYLEVVANRGARGFSHPNSDRKSLLNLPQLSQEVLQLAQKMALAKERLGQLYSRSLNNMLRRTTTLSNEEKEKFLQEEKSISATSYALESLSAVEKQIRILWAKTKNTLSVDLSDVPVLPSAVEKASNDSSEPDPQAQQISDLVGSLLPQIQVIKDQHFELIQTSPTHIQQHQQLQGQLRSLMIQTLELFQREHNLRLREAHTKEMSHSFVFAHGFLDALKSSGALPRSLGLPAITGTRMKLLEDTDDEEEEEDDEQHAVVRRQNSSQTTAVKEYFTPNSRSKRRGALEHDAATAGDERLEFMKELFAPLPHELARDQVAFTRALTARTQLLISKLEEADGLKRRKLLLQQYGSQWSSSSSSSTAGGGGIDHHLLDQPLPPRSPTPFFDLLEKIRTFYGETVRASAPSEQASRMEEGSGNTYSRHGSIFPRSTNAITPPVENPVPRGREEDEERSSTGNSDTTTGSDDDDDHSHYHEFSFIDPSQKARLLLSNGFGPNVKPAAAKCGTKIFKLEYPKARHIQSSCSSKVPRAFLVPIYIGSFKVEGDPIPYTFNVSSQIMGNSTFECPPLRGWYHFKDTSERVLGSPTVCVAGNLFALSTIFALHKVSQIYSYLKPKD